ncbi:hypothetical protein GPJ56_002923 [Histomonas meleagridis]|uniref:uncharacterized protein n=1 Tax=Histomonas meleagridis TaxID=135588 RepID=UPI003559770C|nr:hypothetical protein GPJ56_002923 [Histomonas meleagridis]KAH0800376.1 hypothetical protein GO595_006787 [Histomonas meleagridis]
MQPNFVPPQDQLLMRSGNVNPNIQSNSQYDQSISFDDDEEDSPNMYSPRPDPNDILGIDMPQYKSGKGQNSLSGFEIKFDDLSNKMVFNYSNTNSNQREPDSPLPMSLPKNRFSPNPTNTPPELTKLFSMMNKFQPTPLDISPHFKPFSPDLIPSIGSVDAFIKVPRPDGEQDPLGLSVIDEPTIGCSNPQILRMQLREKFGIIGNEGDGYIGFIEDPSHNHKALASFLESYDEISRNRAAPNIAYSYKMPNLEDLMQFWPEGVENALQSLPLPTADLDLSLEEYIKVVCAVLGIPVKGNIVESMHMLFTLYQQFKENQHFPTAMSRDSTPQKTPPK